MTTMYVYVNLNGGNPKMWVYSTTLSNTNIAWGSCFSGGHQKSVKDRGYGLKASSEKTGKGYIDCGRYDFTGGFNTAADVLWSDLRSAANGASISTETRRATVLHAALDAGHRQTAKRYVNGIGPSPVAPPATPQPKPLLSITSVIKTGAKDSGSNYDW